MDVVLHSTSLPFHWLQRVTLNRHFVLNSVLFKYVGPLMPGFRNPATRNYRKLA